jgi:hypothetical protein
MNERSFIVKSYFAIPVYSSDIPSAELPSSGFAEHQSCAAGDGASECVAATDRSERHSEASRRALTHDFVFNPASAA